MENKNLKDWTFDDVVNNATEQIIEGIAGGRSLRSTVYWILDLALRWREEQKQNEQ